MSHLTRVTNYIIKELDQTTCMTDGDEFWFYNGYKWYIQYNIKENHYQSFRYNTNIVDVGCSTGKLLKAMIQQNSFAPKANYYGIEIEEDFYKFYDDDMKNFKQLNYYRDDVRSFDSGTNHIWDVWNELGYERYEQYKPAFAAEFGFNGPGSWTMLANAIGEQNLDSRDPNFVTYRDWETAQITS